MPTLIVFVIRNFANGFLLGAASALAFILLLPSSGAAHLASQSVVGLWLIVYSLGSTFGMGSLATALWLDIEDN